MSNKNDNIEQLLEKVQQKLTETADPIKALAEDALKQSKETGELGRELKNKVDEALKKQGNLVTAQADLTDAVEGIKSENAELRQELAARNKGGKDVRQTLGQAFVNHEEIKNWMDGEGRGSKQIRIENAITSTNAGSWPDQERGVVGLPMRQLRIRSLLMPGSTQANMVKYRKQATRTNNAAPRAEGGKYAESNYTWIEADAAVRSIAHHINVSEESYNDADYLAGEIDNELVYGLDLKEDTQLLSGDGSGNNLSGLTTEATAYSAAFKADTPSIIDTIRLGLLQASLADYPADGVVLHPTDWAFIELIKDANKNYIISNPANQTGGRMWGRPVIETQSMSEDKFLAGAFRSAGTIYDRKDTSVIISSEHGENFIHGMLTIRADKRLAFAIKRPAALIFGDLGRID